MTIGCPRYDLHVHPRHFGCADESMEIPAILAECERLGVRAVALTDHLNRPEQLEIHRRILADLKRARTDLDVYFGVELNFMACDGPLALDARAKAEYGFQFTIGGIHETYVDRYDLEKILAIQHRHHLAICENPLVDVLVHPYWFAPGEFKRNGWPMMDSMKPVPASHARELGQAAAQTGTAIEINAGACLLAKEGNENWPDEYVEYLAVVAEQGPMFTVASDAHKIGDLARIQRSWDAFDRLGLDGNRMWKPAGTPMNKR